MRWSGTLGRHVDDELHVLLDHLRAERLGDLLQLLPQAERGLLEFQLVGLDLREVEDVVDDPEQVLGRGVGDADVLLLLRA